MRRIASPIQRAWLARFEWAAFHQRVAPAAQRWDVNINPVVPPVDGFRGEFEERTLVWREHGGKQPRVFAFEDVFVVQNKRLVEFDQFFGADQVAFRARERRLLHAQGNSRAIDAGDHGFLHGNRETLVALLGDRDGFKLYLEPAIDAVRCAE